MSRRERIHVDAGLVDRVAEEVAANAQKAESLHDWSLVTLKGGPFDGLAFPVPVVHIGDPDFWVFLPVSTRPPTYAWYQHSAGVPTAVFWKTRTGHPADETLGGGEA